MNGWVWEWMVKYWGACAGGMNKSVPESMKVRAHVRVAHALARVRCLHGLAVAFSLEQAHEA